MSQQTVHSGGTAVAEPPAPFLPSDDTDGAGDNRRKLILVGAALGVLVLAIVAFFLMKGGGSSSSDSGLVPTHHTPHAAAAAPASASGTVTLPKHVVTPVGRNPFKALVTQPVAAPSAAPGTGATGSTGTSTSTGTGSTTGTTGSTGTTAPVYKPVWLMLKSVTATSATFDVGYSNGKTLRAVRYSGVKAPKSGSETVFAKTFALLGVSNGSVVVKFGDGTAFRLDMQHNYMVVD